MGGLDPLGGPPKAPCSAKNVSTSVIVWPVRLGHGDDDVILMAFVG